MRILYLWDSDYPWDVRAEKICSSLAERGHRVHLAARNLRRRAVVEDIGGIRIHRLRTFPNDRLNYALSFPAFFSPIWIRFLSALVTENKIDLIIVRDLPLALTAVRVGRGRGLPVMLDMAEDYVSMVRDIWRLRKFQGLNLVTRNPHLAAIVQRLALRHVDYVLVVIDEALEVVRTGGGSVARTAVVSNTPRLTTDAAPARAWDLPCELRHRYAAIYTGGLQMGRGLQTVLAALPEIVAMIPEFLFVVVGEGYATQNLKALARTLGVEECVLWAGWVTHDRLFDYIRACKVGLIPHLVSDHVNTTIPNKIFDYMACGLPVIASDARPMLRLLREERCGVVFRSGDAASLAAAVLKVRNAPGNLGENGRRAVADKYNWAEDERRLLDAVAACGGS